MLSVAIPSPNQLQLLHRTLQYQEKVPSVITAIVVRKTGIWLILANFWLISG